MTGVIEQLERRLARLLGLGVWIGSAIVAAGFLASLRLAAGARIEMAGVALIILLPVARVCLMLMTFARRREWAFAWAAVVVLAVIGVSAALGLRR